MPLKTFHAGSRNPKSDLDPDSTEQRLVDLGLLSEKDQITSPGRLSVRSSRRHDSTDTTRPPGTGNIRATGITPNFKKHSIAAGTIPRRSSSINNRRRVEIDESQNTVVTSQSYNKDSALKSGRMPRVHDTDRARSRRERTFVGGECAACEELLEHTLSGERILQFSCGHVAHEACFYEYIRGSDFQYCPTCDAPLGLDSSRGGSILDLSKLSNMVRAIAQNDHITPRSAEDAPVPNDSRPAKNEHSTTTRDYPSGHNMHNSPKDLKDNQRVRIEKLGLVSNHSRNTSENTEPVELSVTSAHQAAPEGGGRKHDYDLHAMETTVPGSPPHETRSRIPAPTVTIRSEFPTFTRSRQQQSLTCLVTVEVPEMKWRPRTENNVTSSPSQQTAKMASKPLPVQRKVCPKRTISQEPPEVLHRITRDLYRKVENWHGLDFQRFGPLRLHAVIRVGKDRQSWQELECCLFGEMLICVKERKGPQHVITTEDGRQVTRAALKGSILIRRHLRHVQSSPGDLVLTLTLTVAELPTFHLQFGSKEQLEIWRNALTDIHGFDVSLQTASEYEQDASATEDDEIHRQGGEPPRPPSVASSYGRKTNTTAPTDYSTNQIQTSSLIPPSLHIPLDIVVVIPISVSMQGLKISLLRDTLRFLVSSLGERDRMGLVTFGSGAGAVPMVGMTTKTWSGWNHVLSSIRPVGQKNLRADAVEGANTAMDLLMQRQGANPVSSILLISDSATSDSESVDFVVQRAEAAKVGIYSFGLGLTHKPDSILELSTRTKASYVYVKDWMILRECIAGCLGSLQTTSHQSAKIRLRLPEGSPAKFVKISGALQTIKRATGRDAEASLGDLRFGDKRDILVQLAIDPDTSSQEQFPHDHWESIVSGLEALGGSTENDEPRIESVEEVPLLQADLTFGDLQQQGSVTQLSRPTLLTVTMLPSARKSRHHNRSITPPIPPHPSIVQRRMELLTSDMLARALTLVSRGQPERAQHLLQETRTILKGLGKGSLPPLPPAAGGAGAASNKRISPQVPAKPSTKLNTSPRSSSSMDRKRNQSPSGSDADTPVPRATVDHTTMNALDADIESSLEWINHPAVFSRDSRKGVLQAIGVISSQRGYSFRTASESLLAERIAGIKILADRSREWRESSEDALTEEQ